MNTAEGESMIVAHGCRERTRGRLRRVVGLAASGGSARLALVALAAIGSLAACLPRGHVDVPAQSRAGTDLAALLLGAQPARYRAAAADGGNRLGDTPAPADDNSRWAAQLASATQRTLHINEVARRVRYNGVYFEIDVEVHTQDGRCPCFVAGTPVATADGPIAIERVTVGQRVLPTSPACGDFTAEDAAALAKYELQIRTTDGDIFVIELLRPRDWPHAPGARPGDTVHVELDEMNVRGPALVTAWDPHPNIDMDSKRGCAVTGTIRHTATKLSVLRLEGDDEPIIATPWHLMYSHTRDDWVAIEDLATGELLRTADGTIPVESVIELPDQREPVFNLEVAGSHRYFVHGRRVLTHNTYGAGSGGVSRSPHARLRSAQGRPVPQAVIDLQRARPADVFRQPDGRYVVRGARGREHIIDPSGEVVTSLRRSRSGHGARVRSGKIRPATPEEFEMLRRLLP